MHQQNDFDDQTLVLIETDKSLKFNFITGNRRLILTFRKTFKIVVM